MIYSNVCANAADLVSYTLVTSVFLRTILNTSATQISHALKSLLKRDGCGHFCLHILIWHSNVLTFWVNISNVSWYETLSRRVYVFQCTSVTPYNISERQPLVVRRWQHPVLVNVLGCALCRCYILHIYIQLSLLWITFWPEPECFPTRRKYAWKFTFLKTIKLFIFEGTKVWYFFRCFADRASQYN